MRSEDSVQCFLRWRGEICISHLLLSCTFIWLWTWEIQRLTCWWDQSSWGSFQLSGGFSLFPLLQRLLGAEAAVLAVLVTLRSWKMDCTDCRAKLGKPPGVETRVAILTSLFFLASSPLNIVSTLAFEVKLLFCQLCKTLRPRWQSFWLLCRL